MLEILEFVFQDFWHWFGTLLLISAISEGIGGIFRKTIIKQINKDKE